jgi:PIN domain nuclease of toxin-antitoxin system
MRVLLDTAVLIFAAEAPERLSKRAYAALRGMDDIREFSAVSLTEIAIKNTLGKLKMPAESVRQAMRDMLVRVLPFTADHAYSLFELPLHHRDPFDRQIVAQALCEGISLVTPDERLKRYEGLKVIW